MSSVTHPRGRLPRRVYWVRRGILLGLSLLLVFGVGRLVGGTGEDEQGSATIKANSTSSRNTPAAPVTVGPVAPSGKLRAKGKAPLLPPNGDCRDEEVSVLPAVPRAWGGAPIVIRLQLQGTQPACTFTVSPESVVVKIVSGEDRIWSSQDCPDAIPTTSVVVRSGEPAEVPVIWSGRRSEEDCAGEPDWALPGFYHVFAAALGSTPTDVQFEVTSPGPLYVTRTPKPRPTMSASPKATSSPSATAAGKQSRCGGDNAASSC
jgi:hypothetical protein